MATNPEFRKIMLIGLGGAGQQVVLRTKRFFLDTYGVLPPSIKILCLDTDDEGLKLPSTVHAKSYAIEPQEFLHLQVPNPSDFITQMEEQVKRDSADPDASWWYIKPLPVSAITQGAGAVRENGRLALFFRINEIITRINGLLTELNDPRLSTRMQTARQQLGSTTDFTLSRGDTQIYVCGSLAGGTGSGTFLDIGLLLRHECPKAIIQGFFLLPWVYRHKAFAYRVNQNAYAALTELDNLQSIMYGDPHFIPYSVRYGNLKVVADRAPYDLFHLVDGRNEYGENIDDVGDLCETIATGIFLSTSSMAGPVQSVEDNLLQFINVNPPRIWNGRYARYSSFGVSSIHYPALELHRLLAAINALDLCSTALRRLKSNEAGGRESGREVRHRVHQEVEKFINELNLHRTNVRNSLCPNKGPVNFILENFEIADSNFPELVKAKLEGEQKAMERTLQAGFEGPGQAFRDSLLQGLDKRLKTLAKDPRIDSATHLEWGACLADHLKELRDETAQELVRTDEQVENSKVNAEGLLEVACKSRYLPLLGGNRKRVCEMWASEIGNFLTARKKQKNLEQEKQFYESLLQRTEDEAAIAVPTTSEIEQALLAAETRLRALVAHEEKNMDILRNRPNHVLLGYGSVVVVPTKDSKLREELTLSYEEFVRDKNIYSPEDYLARYREAPEKLTALFLDHCKQKLDYLKTVDVQTALETLAAESSNADNFTDQQFDHLFRLSAALWSFDSSRITIQQAAQMDKIVNLGFFNFHSKHGNVQIANAAKARFHIRNQLSYSTTGDPYHIWLLNFAAAIPAYYLSGLRDIRESYLEQITPSYHIDADFEMNVPDLFPASEFDNKVLRLLGMAIVKGIDVIRDDKLAKGHRFTCAHEDVKELNNEDPKVWMLFRDMFSEIKDNYVPNRSKDDPKNLYDILLGLLREKVNTMSRKELQTCIEDHIKKVSKKLDTRDFSRLISARLTYREIRELKYFLAKRPQGYDMDFDRYIDGTFA